MNIEQQIYTSCPKGKGHDGISGFQVKARSTGITDAMSRAILRYSNHYRVPRHLRQIENQHYQKGDSLPSHVLAQFPKVITYHHIENDVFGLTHIEYLGKDYSGRPGNFYAHTLVFEPEALQPLNYNPIALANTKLFDRNFNNDKILLDPITDLENYAVDPIQLNNNWSQIINNKAIEHIASALVKQAQFQRPVVLLFQKPEESVSFIEVLLMLMPDEIRCRTTFTTYEPDPYIVIKRASVTNGQKNLQIITTISRQEGGSFEFRPDEYNQSFFIWNFIDNKYSAFPDTTPYVYKIIQYAMNSHIEKVKQTQNLLTKLGAGKHPDTWDILIYTEQLEGTLNSAEAQHIIPEIIKTLHKVAEKEQHIEKSLDIIIPLLKKTITAETDKLFSILVKAYSHLLNRLTSDSFNQRENQLVDLISHALVSGEANKALLIADMGNRSLLLSKAIEALSQKGWLDFGIKAVNITQILSTLQVLAKETYLTEWIINKLWSAVKSLTEKESIDYFDQVLAALASILKQVKTDWSLRHTLASEAISLAHSLIEKNQPTGALNLLNLPGIDIKETIPQVFEKLINTDWPSNLPCKTYISTEEQKSIVIISDAVLKAFIKKEPVNRLLPVFKWTFLYGMAGKVWRTYKSDLLKNLSNCSDKTVVIAFVETIRDLLERTQDFEEVFDLLIFQIKQKEPDTFQQWQDIVSFGSKCAVRTSAPERNINILLKYIPDTMDIQKQIFLLAPIFQIAESDLSVQNIVSKKYNQLIKSIFSEDAQWEIRLSLINNSHNTLALLISDFISDLTPWQKSCHDKLKMWQNKLFADNKALITMVSETLSEKLQAEQDRVLELSCNFLKFFGDKFIRQCQRLLVSLIETAPLDITLSICKPWFNNTDLFQSESAFVKSRADLFAWINQLMSLKSDGKMDSNKALDTLEHWKTFRLRLDPKAKQWAEQQLLELLFAVDIASSEKFQRVAEESIKIYSRSDLQSAIDYIEYIYDKEPVATFLYLLAFAQETLKHIEESETKKSVHIISSLVSQLQEERKKSFWNILKDNAAKEEPPLTEACQELYKMVKSSGRYSGLKQTMAKFYKGAVSLFIGGKSSES